MRRSRRWATAADERGTASIEFIAAGVVLLVPLIYLALALSAAQGAALACAGAARQAARIAAAEPTANGVAPGAGAGEASGAAPRSGTASGVRADETPARRAVRIALADVGLAPGPDALVLTRQGDAVIAAVSVEVTLPFVPAAFGLDRAARIPVTASAMAPISDFAAQPQPGP